MVPIKLGKYRFSFRSLTWKDELQLERNKKRDYRRVVLAQALEKIEVIAANKEPLEVPFSTLEEAYKILDAIPITLVEKAFIVYKGGLPENKKFSAISLYQAPEPSDYNKRVVEQETELETEIDQAMVNAERTFGKQAVNEALEIENQIVAGSRKKDGSYQGANVKND
jgi:hypothetical protein